MDRLIDEMMNGIHLKVEVLDESKGGRLALPSSNSYSS